MKPLFQPFRRLQWKLTFSYIWITVVTQLLILLIAGVVFTIMAVQNFPQLQVDGMQQETLQASTYFLQTPPDRLGLAGWLHQQFNPATSQFAPGDYAIVADQQGILLASVGTAPVPVGAVLFDHLSVHAKAALQTTLSGKTDPQSLSYRDKNGASIIAAPIVDERHQIVGALLENNGATTANSWTIASNNRGFILTILFLLGVLILSLPIIFFAAIIGTVFGFLTARTFTRRIKRLFSVADNWSRGDFSASVRDTSNDELGQLAQRLNGMAEQLKNLLNTRQKLASLEERNRLARDLHDSVKQQVFAISMQVRTAKLLLKSNTDEAQEHLQEAEQLVQKTQQELTSLVRELRPIALENKGLVIALRELVTDWSRQSCIKVSLHIVCEQVLPFALEEALFRVVQEALANVARHSGATTVSLSLLWEQDSIQLSISDNGNGFDIAMASDTGLGLSSMHERIEAIGGHIEIKSKLHGGTCIIVQYKGAVVAVKGV